MLVKVHLSSPTPEAKRFPAPVSDWRNQLVELVLTGLVLFIGLFCSPAIPSRLEDGAALRVELFFQHLAVSNPFATGDGPLALLLQPMFGTGGALAHLIWEMAAMLGLALLAIVALRNATRTTRLLALSLLLIATVLLREAGLWVGAALAARVLWQERPGAMTFTGGLALGCFGLIDFHFWAFGTTALILSGLPPTRRNRDAVAGWVGWVGVTLVGWNAAHGNLSDFGRFLSGGSASIAAAPVWQYGLAIPMGVFALVLARRSHRGAVLTLAAAFAMAAVPLQSETLRLIKINAHDVLSTRLRAWSVFLHPNRFEKRVLFPQWNRFGSEGALPKISEQAGDAEIDVLGPKQLIALANSLRHRPASLRTDARVVVTPTNFIGPVKGSLGTYHRLMAENGFALWVPNGTGFAPWSLWKNISFASTPSTIESASPPTTSVAEDQPVANFSLPARLVFGPAPFASQQVVGKYFWGGGAGRVLIYLRQTDGTRRLLMERGMNPSIRPQEREMQYFNLDLPDSPVRVELEAVAENGGDVEGTLRLVDLQFMRDLTRMVSTTLPPEVLHQQAGFNAMPAIIFSTTEASPIRGENNQPMLMVHLPATLSFAKPKDANLLTGTYGFLPGAYAKEKAGTNGAVFSVSWLSGSDSVRQIFSRTLNPKIEPTDRGPQQFNLDLSNLSDGILQISISPAHGADNAWGWTYLGEIDLRAATEKRSAEERFATTFEAYRAGLRPLPAGIKTTEQKPQLVTAGNTQILRIHAPGEAVIPVTAGRTRATGRFGFADESWHTSGRTDGAEFVVLWRDYHGEVELFRQSLQPDTRVEDRGLHSFTVDLTNRGNGLLVLRTEAGPAKNNYWDWTGWSDVVTQ